MTIRLEHGDCLEVMQRLADEGVQVDAVVTDAPYHLTSIVKRFGADTAAPARSGGATGVYARASRGFMGQTWDGGDIAFRPETWALALRLLKPGGHLVAFSGTRTYHRMVVAIEDAGFEVRDMLSWMYGTGFPKSHDVSKALDRRRDDRPHILRVTTFLADAADKAGVSRAEVDAAMGTSDMAGWWLSRLLHRCQCPTWEQWQRIKALLTLSDEMDAEVWRLNGRKGRPGEAWHEREVVGTADKPKPTYCTANIGGAAKQWEGWGTALKPALEPICLARKPLAGTVAENVLEHGVGALNIDGCRVGDDVRYASFTSLAPCHGNALGAAGTAEARRGTQGEPRRYEGRWPANVLHDGSPEVLAAFAAYGERPGQMAAVRGSEPSLPAKNVYGTFGPSSASSPRGDAGSAERFFFSAKADAEDRWGSKHPTVKPVALMRWLVRLVTPPGGLVLDPFAGSGTTGVAALAEGVDALLIEREDAFVADIRARIAHYQGEGRHSLAAKARHAGKEPGDLPLFAAGGAE